VTQLRDALEADKQKLLTEQLQLTTEVQAVREQLDSAESLNQIYEAKISEQQSHIDALLDECEQVHVQADKTWTAFLVPISFYFLRFFPLIYLYGSMRLLKMPTHQLFMPLSPVPFVR